MTGYDKEFFEFAANDHGTANSLFGDVLFWMFQPQSVTDFGCGNGEIIEAIAARGVKVRGIDKYSYDIVTSDNLTNHVCYGDMEQQIANCASDIVICIEVLEHLKESAADIAVKNIAENTIGKAIVTACPPTGLNPLHLNEQVFSYWVSKFESAGLRLDKPSTFVLKSAMLAFSAICPFTIPAWFYTDMGVFSK